jgi:hypothetical protein
VRKFVSDLRQVSGFSPGTLVSSTNKTDRHDISRNIVENGVKQPSPNPIQGSVWADFTVNDSMFLTIIPISDTVGNSTESTTVDGINLDEIKEFAKQFKIRRLSLGLTQTQVGQALSATEGPAYSQVCHLQVNSIAIF